MKDILINGVCFFLLASILFGYSDVQSTHCIVTILLQQQNYINHTTPFLRHKHWVTASNYSLPTSKLTNIILVCSLNSIKQSVQAILGRKIKDTHSFDIFHFTNLVDNGQAGVPDNAGVPLPHRKSSSSSSPFSTSDPVNFVLFLGQVGKAATFKMMKYFTSIFEKLYVFIFYLLFRTVC